MITDLYQSTDPRSIPTYTASIAAHYLLMPKSTVRSWVFGYRYQTKEGSKLFLPVIKVPEPNQRLLSFTNLVELHILSAIRRKYQISLDKVRRGVQYIEDYFGTEHPLATQKLYTDGIDLFIKEFGQLLNISQEGQIAIQEAVEAHLTRIEWDEAGKPSRLYPFTRHISFLEPKLIVIDPRLSFGQPVLVDTGVPTAILAQRYKAGESIDDLASDYESDRLSIEEAIRCELTLAA